MSGPGIAGLVGLAYVAVFAFWVGRVSARPVQPTPEHNVGVQLIEVADSIRDSLRFVGPDCTVSRKASITTVGKVEVWLLLTTKEPIL